MCGDRLLVQRVGGLWGTEKHNGNIFAQGPTQGYFRSSLKARGCPSLPSHIGHVSVHSGSVKTLSSRERWWPISRQPTVPLPPGGYCPPLRAEPRGHLSQCHTLKGQKSGLLQRQSQPKNQHFSNLFPRTEKAFYLLLCTITFSDNNTGRGDSGWLSIVDECGWEFCATEEGPLFHDIRYTTSRIYSILGKMR